MPQSMMAVAIRQPGGPEVLIPETRPVPVPGTEELLVKVAAAGVNRPDVLQRQGRYPPPGGASDLPGLEIAGEVVATGPGVRRWQAGDKVTGLVAGGGYAEYCLLPEATALPQPFDLGLDEAAAIPETAFTVWHNVFERGRLKSGEVFLVHGGTSGIGTTAIQFAKAFGARVIATAGSAEKCTACLGLGAEIAVNYRDQDFVDIVRDATGGRGADVILDMVGGEYLPRNLAAAAVEGRIVNIAFLRGQKPPVDLQLIMGKRLTLTGSTLRPRPLADKGAIARAVEEKIWPLIARKEFRPVIDHRFPLAEAAAAHARMEEGAHIGKIVLTT